ncbi:hypothetical protein MPSEU_000559600 [Mayamaea pseudoterrestris]|nr:hypothetical protein MPSEU_000559600 [Mayamaea pseudoterrestris]
MLGIWDPKSLEPTYDLTFEGCENLPHQDFQPLQTAYDSFKGFTAQEIIDVSDDFLFGGEDDDDELKALMSAPIMEVAVVTPTKSSSSKGKTGYVPFAIPELIHSVSPASSKGSSPKRRLRECEREDSPKRFRTYQSGNWAQRYEELLAYKEKYGNCMITHTYAENLPLARWVKRQRYQYRLMISGQPSTMIPERVRALEDIGFCWGSQESAWQERFEELMDFKAKYGHTNVPSLFSDNPQLATWVKCQRRQHKLYLHEATPSNITLQRILKLEQVGFEWELKNSKKMLVCKKR